MKKMLLTIALAVVASFAWGQTIRQPLMKTQDVPQQRQQTTSATTTTSEETGTITQYTPASAIVLRETNGPCELSLRQNGHLRDPERQGSRPKHRENQSQSGRPVRVHYVGTGENRVIDRVILEQD